MFDRISRKSAEQPKGIAALFEADPDRPARYSATLEGMRFDYSRTTIDDEIRGALLALAKACDVLPRARAMMEGAVVNTSEKRPALHTALRNLSGGAVRVGGEDVMPEVRETLARMSAFADLVRGGHVEGQGGSYTDIVNVGVGGSDLGPRMAVRALAPYHDGPRVHFIANMDGSDAADVLAGLDPERTLVIVASKSFTTQETMTNTETVRAWMAAHVAAPATQFVALSSELERTSAFGIPPERVFGFADWVGGRYSLWGPIGLALMMAIGPARFTEMLRGAEAMDHHFINATPDENLPLLLALVGIWHRQVCGYRTRAVVPYDQRLELLAAHLQQLEMESNGKGVTATGEPLDWPSGPVIWGRPGTNGQHAFFQLIHQGTDIVPVEFMLAAEGHEPHLRHQHELLIANCLAQAKALMLGRPGVTGARAFSGNRPSTMLTYPKLTPRVLGQIVALYEHRVFAEGVILGINSFDQWGVELGKELATALLPVVRGEKADDSLDPATRATLAALQPQKS